MVRSGSAGVLDRLLADGSPGASAWLAEACAQAGEERALFLAFALAPRRVGRSQVRMDAALREQAAQALPGWQPWRWTLDQVARARLLLAMPEAGAQALVATLDRLFASAGLQELVALYQALALLPHAPSHAPRAAEGIRSSMGAVFEAVALDNPYPQAQLDEPAWNQMVLKCLFVGSRLSRVVGLDQRANLALMRMLCGYAHERWAAGRQVDPELWRAVGPFADAGALEDLARALAGPSERERQAAALALHQRGSPAAAARLAAAPALAAAAAAGDLSWDRLARALVMAGLDRSDAATLAFKLAGIYVLVEAIKLLALATVSASARLGVEHTNWRDAEIIGAALSVPCLLLVLLAFFLLRRSRSLADRALGGPQQGTIDFAGNLQTAQAVAFSVIGALLLADGLPRLAGEVADAITVRDLVWSHLRSDAPNLVVLFFELTCGYWLFFMPRMAARVWMRWSDAGPLAVPDAGGPGPGRQDPGT